MSKSKNYLLAWASLAALLGATPATASPALAVIGVVALAAAVGISSNQQPYEAWEYTEKHGWVGGAHDEVSNVDLPLRAVPGTSPTVVSVCRDALISNAQRFDLASLEAVSGGRQLRIKGRIIAPLEVRAIYKINGVHEVKRSKVRCEVDRAGRVVATS